MNRKIIMLDDGRESEEMRQRIEAYKAKKRLERAEPSNTAPEVKPGGTTIEPWSDEEMDAMAVITEEDVAAAFKSRTPEMQALLGACHEKKKDG